MYAQMNNDGRGFVLDWIYLGCKERLLSGNEIHSLPSPAGPKKKIDRKKKRSAIHYNYFLPHSSPQTTLITSVSLINQHL